MQLSYTFHKLKNVGTWTDLRVGFLALWRQKGHLEDTRIYSLEGWWSQLGWLQLDTGDAKFLGDNSWANLV